MAAGQDYNVRTFQRLLASNYYSVEIKLSQEVTLVIALLALALLVRISAIQSNTIYVDEAIYIDAGRNYIAGDVSQNELNFMFGSYLYPVTTALAEAPQGVLSLRLFSISLNLTAALFVYLITRELFRLPAAFWSLIIFAFWGISMNLAVQAVQEALAIPLVTAALYFLIRAVNSSRNAALYGLLAGICFATGGLSSFGAVAALPALVMFFLTFSLYRHQRISKSLTQGAMIFCFVAVLIIGLYAALTWDMTRQSLLAFNVQLIVPRQAILLSIVGEIGIVAALSVFGILALASNRSGRFRTQASLRPINTMLVLGLIVSILLLQIYHLVSSNARALWHHNTLSLALMAPLPAMHSQ